MTAEEKAQQRKERLAALAPVYFAVPVGRKNAIRRSKLREVLEMDDRDMRYALEELNYLEAIVCNLGGGYFRPDCEADIEAYANYNASYRKKLTAKEYHIRRAKKRFNSIEEEILAAIREA